MGQTKAYRIRGWSHEVYGFEPRYRKAGALHTYAGPLPWYVGRIHNGRTRIEMARQRDWMTAAAYCGIFDGLCQITARLPRELRGQILHSTTHKPLGPAEIAFELFGGHCTGRELRPVLQRLVQAGWLDYTTVRTSPDQSGPVATSPNQSGPVRTGPLNQTKSNEIKPNQTKPPPSGGGGGVARGDVRATLKALEIAQPDPLMAARPDLTAPEVLACADVFKGRGPGFLVNAIRQRWEPAKVRRRLEEMEAEAERKLRDKQRDADMAEFTQIPVADIERLWLTIGYRTANRKPAKMPNPEVVRVRDDDRTKILTAWRMEQKARAAR